MLAVYDSMADSQFPGLSRVAIPRPRIGIERLPARRLQNEPRESMNCKSCRKRKIKCNRLRPSCEACQLFQCPCVYDAVPKKRGPKTDVLEALLKRVDGLEAKLKEKSSDEDSDAVTQAVSDLQRDVVEEYEQSDLPDEPLAKRPATGQNRSHEKHPGFSSSESQSINAAAVTISTEDLVNIYFSRLHAKPYEILDENSTRRRLNKKQLPEPLRLVLSAVALRYVSHPHGRMAAIKLSQQYAADAKDTLDIDEPSVDGLQALLLLVLAFIADGKGRSAYMAMTNAVGMIMALELQREPDVQSKISFDERELRRRLFWASYLLDRYLSCGSRRPSLISDDCIFLRLPSRSAQSTTTSNEGELFHCGSNLQYLQGNGRRSHGSTSMLIDITRILGNTNKYLAAGGVKGDSHFPWHSLSNLSKIRQDLDVWAAGTNNTFSSVSALFGQSDSTILVLSKLVYHLVHCLIYRPFLPVDLAELAGNGQHQSWQIEATNLCFLHANAIAELIELGRQFGNIGWPAIVGYCIATSATVHIHGAHYHNFPAMGDLNVFTPSSEFLAREMQQLSELRHYWACVEPQRVSLESISEAHLQLIKGIARDVLSYTPGFQLEDFFDRYSNTDGVGDIAYRFELASLTLTNISYDFMQEPTAGPMLQAQQRTRHTQQGSKRKGVMHSTGHDHEAQPLQMPIVSHEANGRNNKYQSQGPSAQASSSTLVQNEPSAVASIPTIMHQEGHRQLHSVSAMRTSMESGKSSVSGDVTPNGIISYPYSPASMSGAGLTPGAAVSFNPSFNYALGQVGGIVDSHSPYDPMFGTVPTNAYGSPAAWQAHDGLYHGTNHVSLGGAAAPSPSTKSSTGTQGEDKDPFLTLLEQLAENEQRFNNGNNDDLDFFLSGSKSVAEPQ